MSEKINTVIIEDNSDALLYLKSLLQTHFNEISIVGTSSSVKKGVELIQSEKPELIFLDIELKGGTGFDILKKIKDVDYEVIFTTAHNSYIQKAIEHYAFYYLLKPIHLDSLKNVLERYQKIKSQNSTKHNLVGLHSFLKKQDTILMIKTGSQYINILVEDIVKCNSEGNYTYFLMSDSSKFLVSKPLKYYEQLLTEKGFFRANRFNLINIKHIVSIKHKEEILLSNKKYVNVSVRNKSKLMDVINQLS